MEYTLTALCEEHREPVVDIFNHYVAKSYAAFPEAPVAYDFFDRLSAMIGDHPAVAVVSESKGVVGFACLRSFHSAEAFRRTAELTVFILPEHCGKGLGGKILDRFETEAARIGIDCIVACISSRNEASIRFHEKNGFDVCGRFVRVGRKFGADFDLVWMQKHLG